MRFILVVFTLPWAITVSWGWVLLMWAIRAAGDLRWERPAVLTAVWKPWAARIWKYSTTLGRGVVYQPSARAAVGEPWTRIQHHEHVHVRQVEDYMLLGFIIGGMVTLASGGNWVLGVVLWWSSGMWQLPNFITAALRGGDAYRDSEHERSAYAQTDEWGAMGESWLDRH
jgi:hypothetical protein